MKDLTAGELVTVHGGAQRTTQLTETLTQIQSSISGLAQSNSNPQSSYTPLLMAALLMNRQRAATVVATPGATVVSG